MNAPGVDEHAETVIARASTKNAAAWRRKGMATGEETWTGPGAVLVELVLLGRADPGFGRKRIKMDRDGNCDQEEQRDGP